eukprot:1812496-Lingulodinium_polyedra.AAC.1
MRVPAWLLEVPQPRGAWQARAPGRTIAIMFGVRQISFAMCLPCFGRASRALGFQDHQKHGV